jgi:putative metallopeptidase DUF4344
MGHGARTFWWIAGLTFASCACGASAAQRVSTRAAENVPQPISTVPEATPIEFVVGNLEYLLVHEIGHFVIAEREIPIVGPLENAADYIATLALIREEPLDPLRSDRPLTFLVATAKGFEEAWRTGVSVDAEVPYWGAHALTIQRYYQILCLLYGSDPERFARAAEVASLPAARAHDCVTEYARAASAYEWLLANYGRKPDDGEGAAIEIVYGPPPTRTSKTILEAVKSIQLFERVSERLRQKFTLREPFKLVTRTCGQSQAAWVPADRELVICYELVDALYLLAIQAQNGASSRGAARTRR